MWPDFQMTERTHGERTGEISWAPSLRVLVSSLGGAWRASGNDKYPAPSIQDLTFDARGVHLAVDVRTNINGQKRCATRLSSPLHVYTHGLRSVVLARVQQLLRSSLPSLRGAGRRRRRQRVRYPWVAMGGGTSSRKGDTRHETRDAMAYRRWTA